MTRVYIADFDAHFIRMVRMALAGWRGIEVVGHASEGVRALLDVRRLRPDVLLTDLQLPQMDGLSLLRETRRLRNPPRVIICTRFYSDACMESACRYGASYFLCKPVSFERLGELICDCSNHSSLPATDSAPVSDREHRAARVRALLRDAGISPKLHGSAILVESVLRAGEDDLLMRNLSRGLYVALASSLDSTVTRVERSLRSAIDIAYQRGSLKERFPTRPSNKQFIEYLLRESEAADQ